MTQFADERNAIESRFTTNYAAATPVQYENIDFAQPSEAAWVSLRILSGDGNQVSIGTARQVDRFAGIIQVDIYTPENGGTNAARVIGDSVFTIFNRAQFSTGDSGTITCRTPGYRSLGVANGWYHAVVSVAYQRDRIS